VSRLHRYWITFDTPAEDGEGAGPVGDFQPPDERSPECWRRFARQFGCGVTAWTVEDAFHLVREQVFAGQPFPAVATILEDVDVRTIRLPIPSLLLASAPPNWRGVWFPPGFSNAEWWNPTGLRASKRDRRAQQDTPVQP